STAFCRNLSSASWTAEEENGQQSGLLLGLYHGHEAFLDRVGRLFRTQAQRECFVQRIAFADEVVGLFSEFPPRFLELFQFIWLQRADHVKSGLILKLLKVHLSGPLGRHIFFSSPIQAAFLPCPMVYSFS